MSAFANVDETYCDRGQSYQDSHISEPLLGNAGTVHTPGPNFRVVLQDDITSYPLEHPMAGIVDTVNLAKTASTRPAFCASSKNCRLP